MTVEIGIQEFEQINSGVKKFFVYPGTLFLGTTVVFIECSMVGEELTGRICEAKIVFADFVRPYLMKSKCVIYGIELLGADTQKLVASDYKGVKE